MIQHSAIETIWSVFFHNVLVDEAISVFYFEVQLAKQLDYR